MASNTVEECFQNSQSLKETFPSLSCSDLKWQILLEFFPGMGVITRKPSCQCALVAVLSPAENTIFLAHACSLSISEV